MPSHKLLFPLLLLSFLTSVLRSQDSLNIEHLQPLTYAFNMEEDQMRGAGAAFLIEVLTEAQYTMIGEYHGSKRISEFTRALIPILDQAGYKTMVLEVGPITGQVLDQLDTPAVSGLKKLNDQYLIREEDGYVNGPIPFFEHVEDAAFLAEAKKHKWQVLGIDQEYFFGYPILVDQMYENLPEGSRDRYAGLYVEVKDSLQLYYQKDINSEARFSILVEQSPRIQGFLSKMAEIPKNALIVEAFRKSNYIYYLNATKKWHENNGTRIQYMKEQLRTQLAARQFDLSKDRLLIKMGGYHLSKGFSPLSFFEVGNTLHELAAFHGNTALNIAFSNRFYMEDGQLVDILEKSDSRNQAYRVLNQMGKKDQWVVIDLRPMVKAYYYYPQQYLLNNRVQKLVERYDLLLIPPTDLDPTPNYKIE